MFGTTRGLNILFAGPEFLESSKQRIIQLWGSVRQRSVFLPTLFIFLWQATPQSDSAMFYFTYVHSVNTIIVFFLSVMSFMSTLVFSYHFTAFTSVLKNFLSISAQILLVLLLSFWDVSSLLPQLHLCSVLVFIMDFWRMCLYGKYFLQLPF